jgi:hypothetical protein
MAKSEVQSKEVHVRAEETLSLVDPLPAQVTMVPEIRQLTKSVSFAIRFATISPTVLILLNLLLVNLFHWTPIPDFVVITYIAASSFAAILQPVIAKILEKVVGK